MPGPTRLVQQDPPGRCRSWQHRVTAAFVELADTLVVDFDVTGFLHILLKNTLDLLAADAGGLMLADHTEGLGYLRLVTASSAGTRTLELLELQTREGPCVDCCTTGEPVLNVDRASMVARWPTFGVAAINAGHHYVHALPLRHRGLTIGALNLFCADQNPLSPDGIILGQGLADIATIGLLQQRRYDQQRVAQPAQLNSVSTAARTIEHATGIFAGRHQVSPDEALTMLRTTAKDTGRTLSDTATDIVSASAAEPARETAGGTAPAPKS